MRVIKFRVWDGYEMSYPFTFKDLKAEVWFEGELDEEIVINIEFPTQIHTLRDSGLIFMQYTNFNDKNDREIYAGDILRFVESHQKGCNCDHCWPAQVGDLVVVKWVDDGWMVAEPEYYVVPDGICEECSTIGGLLSPNHEIPIGFYTVIAGNVHENKNLLGNK